ncbi:MAG TPA: GDSL-type esterase/lipase family protein [Xanthobacteraceae bacterium]|jgi:acyl-CoA thioesterase-1|nr:GDSL-type esterase/lipase family protein [Xanthobacteraceae bacterium]
MRLKLLVITGAIFAAGLAPAVAQPVHIVAFGDSNTAGFRVLDRNTYPAQLERALRAKGYDVRVKNSGISGETSGMGLRRFDRAIPQNTNVAIVYFGRNDLRWGIEAKKIRANIDTIVKKLTERGIRVLLVGLRTFDLSDVALQNGALYYPDFFKGVAKDGEKDPQYTLVLDPIQHLNTKGYAVVVENLLPSVELLLQTPPPLAMPAPAPPAAMQPPPPPRSVTR